MSSGIPADNERYGITAPSYHVLQAAFRARPAIETVILFGSRAKGTPRRGSDIDLALTGAQVTRDAAEELARYLNHQAPIPYAVDVVSFAHLEHEGLREHITRVGRVIYEREDVR